MYYSEQVCDLQGVPRTLIFQEDIPRKICGMCFSNEVCIKCKDCKNWICDACQIYSFKKKPRKIQKFRVFEIYCPICDGRIGANFL